MLKTNSYIGDEPEVTTAQESRTEQAGRLRALIRRVMRDVPFYRDKLRDRSISFCV